MHLEIKGVSYLQLPLNEFRKEREKGNNQVEAGGVHVWGIWVKVYGNSLSYYCNASAGLKLGQNKKLKQANKSV